MVNPFTVMDPPLLYVSSATDPSSSDPWIHNGASWARTNDSWVSRVKAVKTRERYGSILTGNDCVNVRRKIGRLSDEQCVLSGQEVEVRGNAEETRRC